jgi:uncharacterized protein
VVPERDCARACDRVLRGIGVGMLTALQRQLIYFPDSTAVLPAGDVIEGARDITLRTSHGLC